MAVELASSPEYADNQESMTTTLWFVEQLLQSSLAVKEHRGDEGKIVNILEAASYFNSHGEVSLSSLIIK